MFANYYCLLRHGESEANRAAKIVSSPSSGKLAFGLTAEGKEQVLGALRSHPWIGSEVRILSSVFLRARESAEIAAGVFGAAAVEIDERLNERFFGPWEGASSSNYARVWADDSGKGGAVGVESPRAVAERMLSLISSLEQAHSRKHFLLVSHGDPIQMLLAHCQGLEPGEHRSIPPVLTAGLSFLPKFD